MTSIIVKSKAEIPVVEENADEENGNIFPWHRLHNLITMHILLVYYNKQGN